MTEIAVGLFIAFAIFAVFITGLIMYFVGKHQSKSSNPDVAAKGESTKKKGMIILGVMFVIMVMLSCQGFGCGFFFAMMLNN
jgi:hypothetical protein